MNALYVTVSIPILLLLAGFNHAHGLSTFGRSPTVPPNSTPEIPAKTCTRQEDCKGINGTSCVDSGRINSMLCLCGNNERPRNGICPTTKKAAFHMCNRDEDCVEGANCKMSNSEKTNVCLCEDFPDARDCNSGSINGLSTIAAILMAIIPRIVGYD